MQNSNLSFFQAPITNKRPSSQCSVASLHQYITHNERLKALTEEVRQCLDNREAYRKKKLQLLPYVSPAGVFSYCNAEGLICPSGDYVVDLDGLPSYEEACRLRDALIADPKLHADLAFVSPSARGVKLFIPFRMVVDQPFIEVFRRALESSWAYIEAVYKVKVDRANADICRGCIVCYDPDAKLGGANVECSSKTTK